MSTKIRKLLGCGATAIGLLFIICVLFSNVIFSADLSDNLAENITINMNSIISIIITFFGVIGVLCTVRYITNFLSIGEKRRFFRVSVIVICCVIYFIAQIWWINYKNVEPNGDQFIVRNLSIDIYKKSEQYYIHSLYFQLYPQQLPLADTWANIYGVVNNYSPKVIQYCNAALNTGSLLIVYFITKRLCEDKLNGIGGIILFIAFIPIAMLCTFVYGDIPGLFFCLLAILTIMKYRKSDKLYYWFVSATAMAIAYYLRMNNLIVLIAIAIYQIVGVLDKRKSTKRRILNIALVVTYIIVAILPGKIVANTYQNKYQLDKNATFPIQGFLYMGMSDGSRAPGWYNEEISSEAFKDAISSKEIYNEGIRSRVDYFSKNPKTLIKFYNKKIISMWDENTYQSVWYNIDFYNTAPEVVETNVKMFKHKSEIATIGKIIVCSIMIFTSIVILKKRFCVSDDELLCIILFCGGFLFHMLWEGKSRYIITYIIYLIPVAVNGINIIKMKIIEKEQ